MNPRCLLLAVMVTAASAADAGVALGNALIVARDLDPDTPVVALPEHLQLRNHGPHELPITATTSAPDGYSIADWECGYEAPPPEARLRLRGAPGRTLVLPAGGRSDLELTLDLPSGIRSANRHWVFWVDIAPVSPQADGVQLSLRARILVETGPRPEHGGGELGVAPSRAELIGGRATVSIRNGAEQKAIIDLLPLSVVYAGDLADRRLRFVRRPADAVRRETVTLEPRSFVLAARESGDVAVSAKPVPGAEEVWFVCRRATRADTPQRTIGGIGYDRIELLRIRHPPQ